MTPFAGLLLLAALADAPLDKSGEARARAVAPFVEGRTVAILHLDLTALARADAARDAALARLGLAGLKKELAPRLRRLAAARATDLFVVASLADDDPPFLVVPLGKDTDAKAVGAVLRSLPWLAGVEHETIRGALVGGSAETRKRLRALEPVRRPELAAALAGAGPARLALAPTLDTARIVEEVMPNLPEELGGGPTRPLARGLRWAAVRVEPRLSVRLTVQAADNASARAIHDALGRGAKALAKSKEAATALPGLDKLLLLWAPKVEGDRVVLVLDEKLLAPALRPQLERALEALDQQRSSADLSAILVATHRYEERHGRFPAAASHDAKGRPLLSWRVHLLPYLGQGALYKEFRLDEPWDSAHNKKLLAKMPAVYRPASPKLADQHKTTYLAPRGEGTMFPGRRGVRIAEVTDGTSRTILLVEGADEHAVAWTRPDDLNHDPKAPAKGLSTRHGGKFMVGTADGSVHFLGKDVDKMNLAALFTRAGGEEVTLP